MKISLHIEADTPQEFQAALDVLHAQMARTLVPELIAEPIEEPKVEAPVAPTATIDDDIPEPTMDEPAEAPVEPKRARGRPRKPKQEPAPEAAASAVTPQPMAQVEEPVPPVVAAPKKAEPVIQVNRQDLLDAFSEYVQRYGASFGFTDISTLLQKHFGENVRKASDVTEQALPVAIGAIKAAIAENPFNRKRDYA